jgi:hypothetical protein
LPELESSRLLILRNAGDEASVALQFGQFFALIPYRIFTHALALTEGISAQRAGLGVRRLVGLVGAVVTGLVMSPMMIATWIAQISFNFDVRSNNPYLSITAETTPPGEWSLHLFTRDRIEIPYAHAFLSRVERLKLGQRDPVPELGKANVMIHSGLYWNWRALEIIARWMIGKRLERLVTAESNIAK